MKQTDSDIEKGNLYKQMLDTWAWKDFDRFLETIEKDAVNQFLSFSETDGIEFKLGQLKGEILCVRKIKNELAYIVSEK